jgi:hypothetical protein
MLARYLGADLSNKECGKVFFDTQSGWQCNAAEAAYEFGIISGPEDGRENSRHERPITRGEAMIVILNATQVDISQTNIENYSSNLNHSTFKKQVVRTGMKFGYTNRTEEEF